MVTGPQKKLVIVDADTLEADSWLKEGIAQTPVMTRKRSVMP